MTEPSQTSPTCVSCLKERTLQYRVTVRSLLGKRNCPADFLSRYSALKTQPDFLDKDLSVGMAAATVPSLDFGKRATLDEDMVLQASLEDPIYQLLVAT